MFKSPSERREEAVADAPVTLNRCAVIVPRESFAVLMLVTETKNARPVPCAYTERRAS